MVLAQVIGDGKVLVLVLVAGVCNIVFLVISLENADGGVVLPSQIPYALVMVGYWYL